MPPDSSEIPRNGRHSIDPQVAENSIAHFDDVLEHTGDLNTAPMTIVEPTLRPVALQILHDYLEATAFLLVTETTADETLINGQEVNDSVPYNHVAEYIMWDDIGQIDEIDACILRPLEEVVSEPLQRSLTLNTSTIPSAQMQPRPTLVTLDNNRNNPKFMPFNFENKSRYLSFDEALIGSDIVDFQNWLGHEVMLSLITQKLHVNLSAFEISSCHHQPIRINGSKFCSCDWLKCESCIEPLSNDTQDKILVDFNPNTCQLTLPKTNTRIVIYSSISDSENISIQIPVIWLADESDKVVAILDISKPLSLLFTLSNSELVSESITSELAAELSHISSNTILEDFFKTSKNLYASAVDLVLDRSSDNKLFLNIIYHQPVFRV